MSDDLWVEKLYKENMERLYKTAVRLLNDSSLAQDMVQEAFEQLLLHPEVRTHPNPAGWLFTTLRNLINNENRLSYKGSEVPMDEKISSVMGQETENTSLRDVLPPELSEDDKKILVMYFEQQMSYKQISKELGISQAACGMKLNRAKARYKRILEKSKIISFYLL